MACVELAGDSDQRGRWVANFVKVDSKGDPRSSLGAVLVVMAAQPALHRGLIDHFNGQAFHAREAFFPKEWEFLIVSNPDLVLLGCGDAAGRAAAADEIALELCEPCECCEASPLAWPSRHVKVMLKILHRDAGLGLDALTQTIRDYLSNRNVRSYIRRTKALPEISLVAYQSQMIPSDIGVGKWASCRPSLRPNVALVGAEPMPGVSIGPVEIQRAGTAAQSPRPGIWNAHLALSPARAVQLQAMKTYLEKDKSIRVSGGACVDAESLSAALQEWQPDALLLDFELFSSRKQEPLWSIRRNLPETELILLLPGRLPVGEIGALVSRGISGCLLLDSKPEVYRSAIEAVRRGEYWFPRWAMSFAITKLLSLVDERDVRKPERSLHLDGGGGLTERERSIFDRLRRGLTNKQIAREIGISDHTVKQHIKHIFEKLGLNRRSEVI